jgi:diguanylate cyclase (GGDEF)-like protein
MAEGAYILTSGWLRNWKGCLSEWGFDRKTAGDFFSECTKAFVLLDTGVDADAKEMLQKFADYVGISSRAIRVGLEHYKLVLNEIILKRRLEQKDSELDDSRKQFLRAKSYQAMILDFISNITHMGSENDAIGRILDLFSMLFGPERIVFASVQEKKVVSCASRAGLTPEIRECQSWLDESQSRETDPHDHDDGYSLLRISYQNELYGILMIENLMVAGNRSEYRELARPLAYICGLALFNARMYQSIEQLAVTDSLTGMFNRRQSLHLAEREFVRAKRYSRALSVIMADIDLFKRVNDECGHKMGDEVIAAVAGKIQEELRDSDFSGRFGGEEFVVFMPETDLEPALLVAERIRLAVQSLDFSHLGSELKITLSLGVATLDAECANIDTLLDQSDRALYAAKNAGRNQSKTWPLCTPKQTANPTLNPEHGL